MRISDEGSKKRIHYRHEFAIRSKRYEELKKEIAELEKTTKGQNYVENVVVDKRYFRLLAELLVYDSQPANSSAIQVKHKDGWFGLDYQELPIKPEVEEFSTIHAVDKQEKTVIVKIHLDRKKEDIIKDVKFLLNLLDKEAKSYKVDLKTKRPQWDVYNKYLKVWGLRKERKSWKKIASEVLPEEEIEGAMRKVRSYHDQCKKMIDGGWKQI